MAKLTAKQQKFIEEYLIDLNATQAAIRAGYSEKNADKIGPELLGKTRVSEHIQKAMNERSKRTEITADRVLQEYAKIGFADIKNFLTYRTEKQLVGYDPSGEDGPEPVYDYRQIIDVKPSDDVDGSLVSEVSLNSKGVFSFKLHDKKGALDSIARHLGMFNDKIEHSGTVTNKIDLSQLTVEELRNLAKRRNGTTD